MLQAKRQPAEVTMTPATQWVGYETLVLSWYENPKLWQYFRTFPPAFTWNSPAQMAQIFANHYLVLLEGQPVGLCGVYLQESANKRAEFSLLLDLDDKVLRREVSRQTLQLVESYVFDYLDFNKLVYKLLVGREKLGKATQAEAGFEFEGTRKQDTLYKGKFYDENYYVKFKENK